jgi:hypothetical protein
VTSLEHGPSPQVARGINDSGQPVRGSPSSTSRSVESATVMFTEWRRDTLRVLVAATFK